MGMRAHITSKMLEDSNVSALGFNRAFKRIGLTPLAEGTRQHPVAEVTEDMVAAFTQLSYVKPEKPGKGTLPFRMVASEEEAVETDEPEVDIPPLTDEVIPVSPEIQPAKLKVVKTKSKKSERNAARKAAKRYRKAQTKAKKEAAAQAEAPVTEAKAEVKAEVIVPPKVQREKVSKAVTEDPTRITNQGIGEVQYVSNTISIGRVATYDHYENFLGMKTKYETRFVEQAYIDWLESHPNDSICKVVGRGRKLIKRTYRQCLEIGGNTILLGLVEEHVYVPVNYEHRAAQEKTYHSERSRGRKNNVISIDSKREQGGVPSGEVNEPIILSSKDRILAAIVARKIIARHDRRKAIEGRQANREVAKAVRQVALEKLMLPRSGQVKQTNDATYPIIYCAEDALYEELRLKQEPGCGDVIKVEADPPPWDEPEQGVPAGAVSIDEQINRLEIMEVITQDRLADDPVSYYMWLRDGQVAQEVRLRAAEGQETMLMNALGKMEAKQPSTHQCCEVGRLDSWYKSKCWMSPELEQARLESWFFERYDLEQALLTMNRLALKVPWVADLPMTAPPPTEREVTLDEAMQRQRQRFESLREQAETLGLGRVTSNVEAANRPVYILTDPKASERNVAEGIMSSLTKHVKKFSSLSTVVPKEKLAAVFEGFTATKEHGGLYLPQLE